MLECLLLAAPLIATVSCRDERMDVPDYTRSGVPVTATLQIAVPRMQNYTRADLDKYNLNHVKDLMVRTYSSSTGLPTSDWKCIEPDTHSSESSTGGVTGTVDITLTTQSGYNYIVAVANTKSNNGFTLNDSEKTPKPLSELLQAADTWEKFLEIVATAPSDRASMNGPAVPLPMAGCYIDYLDPETKTTFPHNGATWESNNFTPCFIPLKEGTVELPGAIHLRRLVSHINFNVKSGNSDLKVEVNSFEVVNAPKYSWVYERGASEGESGVKETNYGNLAQSPDDAIHYYANVTFPGNLVTHSIINDEEGNNLSQSSFDFWISENKHTGNSSCDSYKKRAALFKSEESSEGTENSGTTGEASTLFHSLCPTDGDTKVKGEWTSNQLATYVKLKCRVEYPEKKLLVDNKGEIGGSDGDNVEVWRSANVEYMVHLGYIGGVATDFNAYRNGNYTYNVIVNGLDNIRLEAWNEEEHPGQEGIVNDLTEPDIELDCHYAVFNIHLTNDEINADGFGFIITTFRNGVQYTYTQDSGFVNGVLPGDQVGSGTKVDYDESARLQELYNWIELIPTDGEYHLAPYKPRFVSGTKTFLLTDIKNAIKNTKFCSSSGWYTVYVNEYTYEPIFTGARESKYGNESQNSRWKEYVNQNPRRFYITTKKHQNGNSVYTRSKYGVSQRSIQTYYSENGEVSPTAIGVERVNETLGMNMRTSFAGTEESNGRFNLAQWLMNNKGSDLTFSPMEWNKYLKIISGYHLPQVTPEVSGVRAQNGPTIPERSKDSPHPVPLLAEYSSTTSSSGFIDPCNDNIINTGLDGLFNGQLSSYIEAINACMNRNRDNNGDGLINPEELRWYVPSLGEYLRILVGSESLDEPLMEYEEIIGNVPRVNNEDEKVSGWGDLRVSNACLTRYMYISSYDETSASSQSSNPKVMWAIEGTTISNLKDILRWNNNNGYPWQVRCIRNLGTNLKTLKKTTKVDMAYVKDENENIIRMRYYDIASIRANRYVSNGENPLAGEMPIHFINDSKYNTLYKGFEYAAEDITLSGEDLRTIDNIQEYIMSNPCQSKGNGWRIPNQKELAVLRNLGVFENTEKTVWISCTASLFNMQTGTRGKDENGKISPYNYIMLTKKDRGTLGEKQNLYSKEQIEFQAVRCVRDL